MVLAVIAAALDLSRRRFTDVFLMMGWLHLALIAQRNLPLFSICAAPAVARSISWMFESLADAPIAAWLKNIAQRMKGSSRSFDETDGITRTHVISGLVAAATVAVLLLTPAAPGAIKSKTTSTYDPESYPEKALALLKSPETKRIFAEDEWGDYLIYHLYPLKKVFVDGRSDFYGDSFGERYLDLLNVKYDWQETLDKAAGILLAAERFGQS